MTNTHSSILTLIIWIIVRSELIAVQVPDSLVLELL